MSKIISRPFPTIEMVSARASELGISYGKYCCSQQYKSDIADGWYLKHYTKSARKKVRANDRKADSDDDGQSNK